MKKPSQREIIYTILKSHAGRWVEMPKLANAAKCFAVNSRVSDLRIMDGCNIRQRNKTINGVRCSYYMLIPE